MAKSASAKFGALTLASMTEAVRRALLDHHRRGQLVASWDGEEVRWVSPGEHLHEFPLPTARTEPDKNGHHH